MKRESEYNQYEVSKCNPWFFWQDCLFCKQEFRREDGWRFSLQRGGNRVISSFSCAECSTTKQHLEDNIKGFLGHRPKAPAAPPKPSIKIRNWPHE